ncbi:MAG: hypothetical protein RLZZ450_1658 [Pseudomonadota bacterium]|jgi:uncharacterized protein (DUF58 family)
MAHGVHGTLPSKGGARRIMRDQAVRLKAGFVRARELSPLTLRGASVGVLTALALRYYGFEALDAVWYVTGLGLLALFFLALLSVLVAALRMKVWLLRSQRESRGVPPTRAASETRRPVDTGFSLPNLRFWLLVEVRLEVRAPAGVELAPERAGSQLVERVRFGDHGEVRNLARTIVVRDVFGIASIGLRQSAPVEVDVLPHAGALRSLPLLRSLSGGDDIPHPMGLEQGDRLELRRYAPGDPARFIHWKVFARTQKLVVRMPERALSRAQRVAAYLVAGPADGASAAAARVALEEGVLGADFRFGADGSPEPTRDQASALVSLRRSSAARAHSGEQLSSFLQQLDREGPSSLVLFVPAASGPWVDQVATLLQKQARSARVVIGVDGITQREGASWVERLTLAPRASTQIQLAELRALITSYKRAGCEVVVLDRESGRLLGDAHLNRPGQAPSGTPSVSTASSTGAAA